MRSRSHRIIIFIAKGSGIPEQQVADWGVGYDQLIFGKTPAYIYLDDKALHITEYRMARFGQFDPVTPPCNVPCFAR